MPQSLSLVIVHFVFSTKDRRPFLEPSMTDELYPYLATIVRANGCECYRVGGTEDHVHFAVRLGRTVSISNLIEDIKTSTSKWIKHRFAEMLDFAWQKGYGSFSVCRDEVESLIGYIDFQREHHMQVSFMDEYRRLLDDLGIVYNEQYLFD